MLALLACGTFAAYDFTKPNDGNELKATLKDERDTTFIVFFRTDYTKDTTPEGKANAELVKNITEEVKKKCTDQGLKDSDYSWIDVELELTGTAEKDPKRSFGKLLADLGFEDKPAAAGGAAPAGGSAAPATLPATDPACKAGAPADPKCPQCQDPAAAKDATKCKPGATTANTAGGSNEPAVPLAKLAKAPYALVIRNQQGYRVSGNNIPTELCYQAKQFKLLADQQAQARK